jgi:ATP-dependent RNA helicase DOB1
LLLRRLAILPLLKRGIGIHHGGLIPLVKEVVELLFGERLLKCLFTTETFAMGINMPSKTVVFTAARKFDGNEFRWVSAGEYIQMSGRAGRRGIDDRGIVIQMVDEKMDESNAKEMLKGNADPLISSFHLGYNMLINMLRLEDIDIEFLVENSLKQHQAEVIRPSLEKKLIVQETELNDIEVGCESDLKMMQAVEMYWKTNKVLQNTTYTIQQWIRKPMYSLSFLQTGRLIRIVDDTYEREDR